MRIYYKKHLNEDDELESTECRSHPFRGSIELEISKDGHYVIKDERGGYTLAVLYNGELTTFDDCYDENEVTSGVFPEKHVWENLEYIYVKPEV